MPYSVKKRGSQWCVVRDKQGGKPQKTMGCHPSEEEAQEQQRALYAAENDREN